MAARNTSRQVKAQKTKVKSIASEMEWKPQPMPETTEPRVERKMNNTDRPWKKYAIALAVILVLAALWWWRTNSWPVVAMVGNSPITRHEIEENLFKQYGQQTIEGLITQKQIENELNRQGIKIDENEIDKRIDDIKTSLGNGADFDAELKTRGMDMNKLRELIRLQLRLNKAVEDKATVSAEEVQNYIKQNGSYLSGKTDEEKKAEAEQMLKQDKQNSEIEKWVEEAKKQSNVWRLYPAPTTPAAPTVVPPTPQVTPTVTPKK